MAGKMHKCSNTLNSFQITCQNDITQKVGKEQCHIPMQYKTLNVDCSGSLCSGLVPQ